MTDDRHCRGNTAISATLDGLHIEIKPRPKERTTDVPRHEYSTYTPTQNLLLTQR